VSSKPEGQRLSHGGVLGYGTVSPYTPDTHYELPSEVSGEDPDANSFGACWVLRVSSPAMQNFVTS